MYKNETFIYRLEFTMYHMRMSSTSYPQLNNDSKRLKRYAQIKRRTKQKGTQY